ncbi:GNAT family N-acetyltransferase [Lactococcus taiwanensis]|uniref:GNAT family N-acetyltransferase n=1 Tax=Lactococcus taiwanensis TaxID=1151742 RepID=UPI00190838B7|nr:GNAT family N-acetyltransferase [Lactococcus taiwanensis]
MKMIEIKTLTTDLIERLLIIWESSVRATHDFLSDEEINNIKKCVPDALKNIEHLIILEDTSKQPLGFMGISNQTLEMLFIADKNRGKGLGKQLLSYGIEHYAVQKLTVNEQNPLARGFYEHMGFQTYKRSEFDEQGNNYPILYMRKID